MQRVSRTGRLSALFFLAVLFGACIDAFGSDRPNIVLLMGDDHGWDEVGYNGHPYLKTPVLDEMAATGLRMDRFYSAHPSCSPTRGSILTGRHPVRYGTFTPNYSMRPEEITIAEILRDAGYACGHFGKWHVGPVKASSPLNPGALGFEEWLSHDNFFELNPVFSHNGGPPEQFQGESSEIIVDAADQFIRRAKQSGKPFFVVVWFGSPHEPYSGLPEDLALYDDLPQKFGKRMTRLTSNETGQPVRRPLGEVLRERYAEITAMDRAIGKLRSFLADQDLRQDTLVWYCGDNGLPIGGLATTPFRAQKGSIYDGGVRVPGVIEWPERISTPRVSDVNAVTTDTLPTILDLLGLPLPNRPLDGISLKGAIDGEMKERTKPICFWKFDDSGTDRANRKPYIDPKLQEGTTPTAKLRGGRLNRTFYNFYHTEVTERDFGGPRSILDNQYKLVIDGRPDSGEELFDLHNDPAEKNSIAEEKPEIAKRLATELREWQQSVLNSLTGQDY